MTPREAYDDCIAQAREAARRQMKNAAQPGVDGAILAALHNSAAKTLSSFADMLEKVREIRCK